MGASDEYHGVPTLGISLAAPKVYLGHEIYVLEAERGSVILLKKEQASSNSV